MAFVERVVLLRNGFVRHMSSVHGSAVVLGRIGARSQIGPLAVIGENVQVGEDCVIGAGTVLNNCNVGNRVVIHPGTCIGQDGFGFHVGDQSHQKKPQTLMVVIEDDVEIGANCTIDRGSWRDTKIGMGTKVDNLVQIGHNVHVGKHCLIAAQTGIAGSTEIGDRVLIGGQVGIAQHLKIGSLAQIAAKSGVISDVPQGAKVGGTPAVPIRQFHKQSLMLKKLVTKNNK